ncbi:putative serine/threonine protein phosphatase [Blyttiomyces sp. JEL0837]|nr:putative serine/threonine protein phosphatase [Blyttiomyces sp. JEL0837]
MPSWDLDAFISRLYQRELLDEHIIRELCEKTKEVLVKEGNVRSISAPATLVGDVHGQFYDVLEIFKIAGFCPSTNYVFLGDYVDRGYYSVETISLLTCLKLRYPDRVTLVRGNHESRAVTQTYGFYAECMKKYGNANVWSFFTDMFDYLVLSVVIEDSIFCVHGGLSPSIHTIDQMKVIDRFREIPHEGPMADLVWSDPIPPPTLTANNLNGAGAANDDKGDFAISPRGAGYIFGKQVTKKFLEVNGLGHICRAHQLCMEGYQILFDDLLSTVWSAPNYCYRAGNMASVLEIGPGLERYFNVFGPCPDRFRESPMKDNAQNGGNGGMNGNGNGFGGDGIVETFDDGEGLPPSQMQNNNAIPKLEKRRRGRGGFGGGRGASRSGWGVVAGGGGDDESGSEGGGNVGRVVSQYFL